VVRLVFADHHAVADGLHLGALLHVEVLLPSREVAWHGAGDVVAKLRRGLRDSSNGAGRAGGDDYSGRFNAGSSGGGSGDGAPNSGRAPRFARPSLPTSSTFLPLENQKPAEFRRC
jgi:hypothetical protein